MKRRDFSAQLAAAALGLPFLGSSAFAQGGPVEGTHYIKLNQPVPVPANGKINIVEFFWYGCPHCNAFEPSLDAWSKKLPADVNFQRAHVAFSALHETHSKIFYSLETMGLVEQMHRKVFNAIHLQHKRLDKDNDIEAFMTENGVDGKKFIEIFKSFAVQTKVRQAKQLSDGYKIDGVPAIGVQGRYWTSVGLAGGHEQALQVVNFLARKSKA
ncbi:thiol:disulfide interchange protein DsbA/DsbL [Ideonella sp. BN130291]|uniref:thiol:disulfide interchange protein DsbA/DsbL n=1 Tax=Ideonella sp. BN130291 TaxID=3112940 RepID=UPI002E266881|nr:thiol:disulfide interchange protein DsbA/DsbL [Ideonella sp. BN130291]